MSRTRRAVAGYALEAGFGRVVRVHRHMRDSGLLGVLVSVTVLAIFAAAIAVFAFVLNESPLWRLPVLGLAGLVGVTAATWFWGPTPDPDRRRWFVIAEHGLLVWSPGSDTPSAAVRWDDLRVDWSERVPQLTWEDGGQRHTLGLTGVSGRGDLIQAVARSGRVGRWTPGRLARTATAAIATAAVVWFAAVPVVLDLVLGERPDDITNFGQVCAGERDFGRAAAYEGRGPHPIAVYSDHSYPEYSDGAVTDAKGWPLADTVQLVGCVRQIGKATPDSLVSCPYEGGYTMTVYQGRYQVEIYEARTGRPVSSFTIDGSTDTDCAAMIYVLPDDHSEQSYDTSPDEASYAKRLASLVNDEAS
ncbi:hypothetical protein [Actinophytocola sediminis]